MLNNCKKIEFLAATGVFAGIFSGVLTVVPVSAAIVSVPGRSTELPAKNILVQNNAANEALQQGINLVRQGNRAGAEAAFRRAIQIDSNFAEAYANLGSVLANQNKLAEALANLQTAIRIKPDVPEFHYMLGQVLFAQNRMSEAVESVKRARELYTRQGKTQEANTLEQVLQDMTNRNRSRER